MLNKDVSQVLMKCCFNQTLNIRSFSILETSPNKTLWEAKICNLVNLFVAKTKNKPVYSKLYASNAVWDIYFLINVQNEILSMKKAVLLSWSSLIHTIWLNCSYQPYVLQCFYGRTIALVSQGWQTLQHRQS